jgi:tetratricopeptide (TPR) repeat protein
LTGDYALAMLVLIAWSNSFALGFAADGKAVSAANRIQASTAENIRLILVKDYWWPIPAGHLYRPVTTLSYLLNYSILGEGDNPVGYHALNVLLHICNAWLVLELAFLLLRKREQAFCAAALWAVHPLATESVTNVAGRADLLVTTATLGGVLLYAHARASAGRARGLAAVGLFVIATVGVFSKENGAVLLGLVLLWDFVFGFGGVKEIVRRLPFYGAVAGSLVLMMLVRWRIFRTEPWPARAFVDNPLSGAGFWEARLTAVRVLGMQLGLLVFPLRLSSDRSYNEIPISSAGDPWAWVSLALIVSILVIAALRYRKNDRVTFWCVGFSALTLLPTSNLIVLIGATMADRFLYMPSIGLAIAAVALTFRLNDPRVSKALIATAVVLFVVRTWLRNRDWNNDLTLSTADVKVSSASFRLHKARAAELFAEPPVGNLDEAIREAEAAWAILRPLQPVDSEQETPHQLGTYYQKKGQLTGPNTDEARGWYRKSVDALSLAREISQANEKAFDEAQLSHALPLAFRLGDDVLYLHLAESYAALGRFEEALDALRYERLLNPASPDPYFAIASLEIQRGNFDSAAVALDEQGLTSGRTQATIALLQRV